MIREATPNDHMEVYKYAHKFLENSPYKNIFDPAFLYDYLDGLIKGNEDVVVLLSEGKGMIVGMVSPFNYGYELIATELGWWVEPEHRSSGVGKELILAFEQWAIDQGCQHIVMVSLDEDLGKYYEKSGYRLVERAYMKELN